MKRCTQCRKTKPLNEFDRKFRGDDIHRKSQCKDCIRTAKGFRRHPHEEAMRQNRVLVLEGRKLCLICRETKPLSDFYNSASGIGAVASYCKRCVLRQDRVRKYGMTLEQVIAAESVTHCPGCLRELDQPGTKRCFDHCHDTGAFRRVLCEGCNVAVGMVSNSPDTLLRLARLLSEPVSR